MKSSKLQIEITKILLGNPSMDAFAAAEAAYDALLAEKMLVDNAADYLLANSWQDMATPEADFTVAPEWITAMREVRHE